MAQNPKPPTLANPKRFRTIQDLTKMRPDCGASIDDFFVIDNELLLIIDTTHLGSILNPYNSPSASYVRTHGVVVASHTRLESSTVFWGEPFLLFPLSCHLSENLTAYLAKEAGVHIKIPNGTYRVFYEQFEAPDGSKKEYYQNIAVQRQ